MLSDELNDYYFIKNMIKQKVILGHITQCFFLKAISVPAPARLKVVFWVLNHVL